MPVMTADGLSWVVVPFFVSFVATYEVADGPGSRKIGVDLLERRVYVHDSWNYGRRPAPRTWAEEMPIPLAELLVDAPRAELAVARGPRVAAVLVRAAERGEKRQVLDVEVPGRWGKSVTPRARSRGPACLGHITHVLNHHIYYTLTLGHHATLAFLVAATSGS